MAWQCHDHTKGSQPGQDERLIFRDDACNADAKTYQPQCSLDEPLALVPQSIISNCQAKTKGMDPVNATCVPGAAHNANIVRSKAIYTTSSRIWEETMMMNCVM